MQTTDDIGTPVPSRLADLRDVPLARIPLSTVPLARTPGQAMRVQRELFVVMPFSEPWSDGTYALIRRAVSRLDISAGEFRLYRADEIATPGQITDHIRDALVRAEVVIADITGHNPNVIWELGIADGLGKISVILNQAPEASPFDFHGRRQVRYHAAPTEGDENNLLRHLIEAIRTGMGD